MCGLVIYEAYARNARIQRFRLLDKILWSFHSPVKNVLSILQVPKTTIWRKLQQSSRSELTELVENEADTAAAQLQERTEFAFSEVWLSIIMMYTKL
jgi:hypothetical protein